MKKLLIMFIYSFLSFEVMSFDNLVGKNLICEGKYTSAKSRPDALLFKALSSIDERKNIWIF